MKRTELYVVVTNALVAKVMKEAKCDNVQASAILDEETWDIGFYEYAKLGFDEGTITHSLAPSKMNHTSLVLFTYCPKCTAEVNKETYDLMIRRKHYQYYHPNFKAFVIFYQPQFVNGHYVEESLVSLDYAINYYETMQKSKDLAVKASKASVAYTHELVNLYNELNKLCKHRLPDFGTEELVLFLERMLRNSTNVDFRSVGKAMPYEKDHFYKFDKMSDYLNPSDVYTDEDNRIVWTTTEDRMGTRYIDNHLEDLLHEALTYRWLQLHYDYTPYIAWDDCDATSNEDVINECIHNRMHSMLQDGIDTLTDSEKEELATMINMHRDIFNKVCDELNIEFKLR